MTRAMRIPRTLIPEVASQVVMFLNISGMKGLFIQFQFSKSLPAGRQMTNKLTSLEFEL
jgi:hypothetical protein